MRRPLLINVGLPRTGTQSFTAAVEQLGLHAAHIVYGEHHPDCLARFRKDGQGKIWYFMQHFDVLSDTPCFGLIDTFMTFHQDIRLVATSRSKESWLNSMAERPGAHSLFIRSHFKNAELAHIFDQHERLLERLEIPKLKLEMDDEQKWQLICGLLDRPPPGSDVWPRVDLQNLPGFRNDAGSVSFDDFVEPPTMPLGNRIKHRARFALHRLHTRRRSSYGPQCCKFGRGETHK